MADLPRYPDSGEETGLESDRGAKAGRPRWQKLLGIIGLLVVVAIAIMLFVGGGHGPSRHGASSAVADGAVEIAVTADDFAYDPDEITVAVGEDVAIALTSKDLLHDFTIDEFGAHIAAQPGETATAGFRADRPGRFTLYCAEPGHRQSGMEGTLLVEAGDLAPEEYQRLHEEGFTPEDFEDLHG